MLRRSAIVGLGLTMALCCPPHSTVTLAQEVLSTAGVKSLTEVTPTDLSPNASVPAPDTLALDDEDDILDLDLEQLGQVDVVVPAFDVEVTSVTKTQSTVGQSPAAVFVITPEMIRRSGATSVPEVLRMAPGLQVARIDANKWAISIRGFNDRYAKKLLVLIDGRSVYTPLYSGVYWDVQDLLLEDIARIEVIRGPGGTIWGANAVNGVINIITKDSATTQGLLASVTGGSEDKSITGFRYGSELSENWTYRVYGKHFERDRGFRPEGTADDWRQGRIGFRTDWKPADCEGNHVVFQGDFYEGTSGAITTTPSPPPPPLNPNLRWDERVRGANLLARWNRQIDETSESWLQFYYDRTERNQHVLEQSIDIFDVELGHVFEPWIDHRVTWGLHDRYVVDDLVFPQPFNLTFEPARRNTNLIAAFAQDQMTLIDDLLTFTIGSKFEYNAFTGFEYQPTARLLWSIDERQVAWGAISRAVRTPARFDDDARLTVASLSPVPPATAMILFGDRGVVSEELVAFELGYRAQPTEQFSWDVTTFTNLYTNIIGQRVETPFFQPPSTMIVPMRRGNGVDGETYGVEVSGRYDVTSDWMVQAAYSFLDMQLHAEPGFNEKDEGRNPRNTVYLQSSWDLPREFEFDVIGRYVDQLPDFGVDKYITLDLRLGWHLENWAFTVVGRNLLDDHHPEFGAGGDIPSEVQRGVFAQVVWEH